jgi:SPP1 family predicted phage head-tail adaptor
VRPHEHTHAGQLRHVATLQDKVTTPDGYGGQNVEWTDRRTLRCEVREVSAMQRMENMRRNSPVTHEVVARFEDDLTATEAPKRRLLFEGQALNIIAAQRFGPRRESVRLFAQSGVAT